jgi:Bacterial Ig domain
VVVLKKFSSLTLAGLILPLLTACPGGDDSSKPSTAITSPASDASVSSTVPVQVDATDANGVSRVEVYARGRNSTARGFAVGSAVSSPYVISWNTLGVPNATDLELVARATDGAGNEGESTPVRVRTANQNVPSLNYLVAYTLPPRPAGLSAPRANVNALGVLDALRLETTRPPASNTPSSLGVSSRVRPQELTRTFALEWSWQAFNSVGGISGVDGYGVFVADGDVAGPYTRVVSQAASTAGTQKVSKNTTDGAPGKSYFGVTTAIQNNRTTETGFSNADGATFLGAQDASSPAEGATVTDGRPVLTWLPLNGATGYLYFVYDKNPWDPTAQLKWSNSPQSTDQLSAAFPGSREKLPSGTYYWWVAGVGFDALGKADSFSFSDPRSFVVP